MIENNPPPAVPGALEYYLKSYFSLCSERLNTLSAIPVTRIYQFANLVGIDDVEEFVGIIESMDVQYLTNMGKIEQQRSNNSHLSEKNSMLAERAKAFGIR